MIACPPRLAARLAGAAALCLLVAACGEADSDPGPGGVTVGEARALDEAAEMLDQQRLPAEALEEPAGESAEGDAPAEAPTPTPATQ